MRVANTEKLGRLEFHAFQNCLSLHDDSLTLLEAKSYASAFFLSVIALEELGKVIILDDMIFNIEMNGHSLKESQEWFKGIFNHRVKQWKPFANHAGVGTPKQKRLFNELFAGKLDLRKQNSLYVGLENRKVTGKILLPSAIKRVQAKRQIRLLNQELLTIVDRSIEGYTTWDGEYLEDLFKPRLRKRLEEIAAELA